jgi:nudix-type nucleoside diphosphatase (YffH/AdpP family)
MEINHEKIVYTNKRFVIEEAQIMHGGKTYSRARLNRRDAAAVLLVNTESNRVILTSQFRYSIVAKTNKNILEIVAGVIDDGEDPQVAAIREAEEETGYRIRKGNITPLLTCFASPGYSSERYNIFFATVVNSDRVSQGGGLESENEHINIVEMDLLTFNTMIRKGEVEDAKTNLAGLYKLIEGY